MLIRDVKLCKSVNDKSFYKYFDYNSLSNLENKQEEQLHCDTFRQRDEEIVDRT